MSENSKSDFEKLARSGCCGPGPGQCSCKIEAVITIDDRGQMVLPKDIRRKAGFAPGEKLVVVSWERQDRVCSLSLIKSDELGGYVQNYIGGMMGG